MTRLKKSKVILGGLLSLSYLIPSAAHAQSPRRYQPATPTVSPYLNLLRNNNDGGLPNYYSLVRPQLQQQAFNQQQQMRQAQQSVAIGMLQSEVTTGLTPTGKASRFMTEGSGASFLNTSRYYPQSPAMRRR